MTTTVEKKFNAQQPRVPAGQTGGGRWTSGAWSTRTWAEALKDAGFGKIETPTKASAAVMGALDTAASKDPVTVTRAQLAAAEKHYRKTGAFVEPTVRYNAREEPTAFGGFTRPGDGPVAIRMTSSGRDLIVRTTRSNVVLEGPRALDGRRTFYRADTFKRETGRGINDDEPPVGRVVVDYILPRERAGAKEVRSSVWLYAGEPKDALTLSARQNDGIAFDDRATKVFGQYSSAVYNYHKFTDSPAASHRLRAAVSAYQYASSPINDALRGKRTRKWTLRTDQVIAGRQHAATLLRTFRKHRATLTMRAPFDLYRGVKGELATQIRNARVGTRLHDGGFSSFSLSTTVSESFGPVVLRIRRGQQVRALPAIRPDELEFILDSAHGFEVVRKKKRGGMILVDVRPIDLRPSRR